MAKLKKLLITFLLIAFLFQATNVWALEVKWPALPGAKTPNQVQEEVKGGVIPKDQTLPLYLNYFLRFIFLVALIVVSTVIIFGGVLYLISGAKPIGLALAKQWISRGFLGLFILVASYLVLGALNPQLLLFKIEKERVVFPPPETAPLEEDVLGFGKVEVGEAVEQAQDMLFATTSPTYAAQVPIDEIAGSLETAATTVEALMEEFNNCKCGYSKWHIEFEELSGKCIEGVSKEDEDEYWDKYETVINKIGKDQPLTEEERKLIEEKKIIIDPGKLVGTAVEKGKEAIQKIVKGGQAICLTKCQNCGTGKDIDAAGKEIVAPECNFEKLRELRKQLKQTLTKLQAQKAGLSSEQLTQIEHTLRLNVASFLLSQTEGLSFQVDFETQKEAFKEAGFEIELDRPPIMLPAEEVAMSPPALDTLTGYVPIRGRIFPPDVLRNNEKIWEEARRGSLFSVLMRLSIEAMEKMIQECLVDAFGEADFGISQEFLGEFLNKFFHQGLGEYLIQELSKASPIIAAQMGRDVEGGIKEASYLQCLFACCVDWCMEREDTKAAYPNEAERKEFCETGECPLKYKETLESLPWGDGKTCQYRCQQTPSNFISRELAAFFTEPIEEKLGDAIPETLDEKVREVIFKKEGLNKILDEELFNFVDATLKGALTKSLEDLIPGLEDALQAQITQVLPEFILGPLQTFERYLAGGLKALREKREEWVTAGVNYLFSLADKKAQGWIAGSVSQNNCLSVTEQGFWFDLEKEECVKATPEKINEWLDPVYPVDTKIVLPSITPEGERTTVDIKPTELCENTDYCWDDQACPEGLAGPPPECCKECPWPDNFKLTGDDVRRLQEEFKVGLINFAGDLVSAFLQTASYTLAKYLNVVIEDEILSPLMPYLNYFEDLQERLYKFLTSSIKDILPRDLRRLTQKNIDQILKEVCKKGKAGEDLEIKLNGSTVTIPVGSGGRDTACTIEKYLYTSLMDEIAEISESTALLLNAKVRDVLRKALCPEKGQGQEEQCIMDYLDKSPAEILWPNITNIKAIIEGTPEQLICGELLLFDATPDGEPIITGAKNGETISTRCNSLKKEMPLLSFPYTDTSPSNAIWNKLQPRAKDFYGNYCPYYYKVCQNPLSGLSKTYGQLIAETVDMVCDKVVEEEVKGVCNGVGCQNCKIEELSIPEELKTRLRNECRACDLLRNNSLAASIFYYGILGAEKLAGEEWSEGKETNSYQWLLVVFADLKGEVRKAAEKRMKEGEFSSPENFSQDWTDLANEVKDYTEPNQLPPNIQAGAKWVVSWFTENKELGEILIDFPLGVIKPFQDGEAALLREKTRGEDKNFLPRTPYKFLSQDVCGKVKADYEKDFPDWTLERVRRRARAEIGRALPYSIEGIEKIEKLTTANYFQIILQAPESEVPTERRILYLSCLSLRKSPSEILGLASPLIRYLRPRAYQILFDLINDKLYDYEKPECLNELFQDYIYQTPVNVLTNMGRKLKQGGEMMEKCVVDTSGYNPEMGGAMQVLATFLATEIGIQIQQLSPYYFNTEIIKILFDKLEEIFEIRCEKGPGDPNPTGRKCLEKKFGWKEWKDIQRFLEQTPMDLAKTYLDTPLINNSDITGGPAYMDRIADPDGTPGSGDETVLGQPYLDTFGRWTGLDKPLYEGYLRAEGFWGSVDGAINKGKSAIQGATEKAFVEAPRAGLNWAVREFTDLLGFEVGKKATDQMTEICRDKPPECDTDKGEIEKTKGDTIKCCNIAANLVCQSKCREINADEEECRVAQGEIEKEESGKTLCCFQDKEGGNECRKCYERLAEDCPTGEYPTTAMDGETKLCCRNRELKTTEEGDSCCENVVSCLAGKFIPHFKNLVDALIYGPSLNELKARQTD